jgi:transposase
VSRKRAIVLLDGERVQVQAIVRQPGNERRRIRARILLLTDQGHSDEAIAAEVHADRSTVERTRRRFAEGGLLVALTERPRPGGKSVLDAPSRAVLAELAGSTPPAGRRWWTMQLLADELMRRDVVAAVSDESVRRALHKMGLLMAHPNGSRWQKQAHHASHGAPT